MDSDNVEIIRNEALDAARDSRQAKLAHFEARRIARSLPVPTDDLEVRHALRARAVPVCFFGEDSYDRRERLRVLMAEDVLRGQRESAGQEDDIMRDDATVAVSTLHKGNADVGDADNHGHIEKGDNTLDGIDKKEGEEEEEKEYYTEGDAQLRTLRHMLALPSLERARARLRTERLLAQCDKSPGAAPALTPTTDTARQQGRSDELRAVQNARNATTLSSHLGDDRPLSSIAIASDATPGCNDARFVATGSWGGRVRVWRIHAGDASLVSSLDVHDARVSNVHAPRAARGVLLSCGADGLAFLLRQREGDGADNAPFSIASKMDQHGGLRVSDAKMHPFRPSLLATAGYDGCFVLHDDGRPVLRQPTGHDNVYRVAFHPDGALLSTCGLEGGVRVWDLRSGRAVMTMRKAHADGVLCMDFCGDGRVLASAGMDNVVRVWDLRGVRIVRTLAAHRSLISGMCFGGGVEHGDVLFTGSFDKSVKCWASRRNWGLLAAHTNFEDKVTAVDCSPDGDRVVAACYDKTWKVLGCDGD